MNINEYVELFSKEIKKYNKEKLTNPTDRIAIQTAVELAYNDTKRTFKGINSTAKDKAIKDIIDKFETYFTTDPFIDANAFDEKHNELCKTWQQHFQGDLAKYGKAQKIVNMTFKYLYCCEEKDERFFQFCHMPLDSFILEWFYRECKEQKIKIVKNKMSAWSSIDYSKEKTENKKYTYNFYLERIRNLIYNIEEFKNLSPLQAEFKIWQEIRLHLATEAFLFEISYPLNQEKKSNIRKMSIKEKMKEIAKKANSYTPFN